MDRAEELLLAAIQAAPDDDAPRLVYADWLQKRGDPRGEFIATQCMLAAMDDDREDEARAELQARQWELFDQHATAWLAELGLEPGEGDFYRGFVEDVRVPLSRLRADLLGQRAVVRELWIAPRRDGAAPTAELRQLLQWPWLALLRALSLPESHLGAENIRMVVQTPHLCNLTRLDLRDNLAHEAIYIISESPILAKLTSLDLGSNHLGDDQARVLAGSRHLVGLRQLGLENNRVKRLTERTVARFSAQLESLELRKNPLDAETSAQLRRYLGKRVRM